jgi:predicted unusual protein kinase regulating ubiquinone biosynthesis (AarF/ABC1/UbiB family)
MIVRLELFKGRLRHKLVLCDAGLVGEMTPAASLNFIELFHAVLRGDGRDAGLQMIRHAPRQECADPEGLNSFFHLPLVALTLCFAFASEFASGVARVVDRVMSSGFQLKLTSVSGILTEMFSLAREHRVQIDGAYATTAVALGILEGTGRRLNSSLDLFKLAFPLVIEVRAKKLLQMI